MSGEHFSGGTMPHTPETKLDLALYENVEKNVVYACTDVALRDPLSGRIFLGLRSSEPQVGPWFIGGRNKYGTGIDQNAALQVKNDLGLDLPAKRFEHIGTYSTDFPIAATGRETHGRHTVNATMCIDLKPDEVAALNRNVAEGDIRDEYSSGSWYNPSEIAEPDSDFPFVIKQFVRDLYERDLVKSAVYEDALQEDAVRTLKAGLENRRKVQEARIKDLRKMGFNEDEAVVLEHRGGANALYSVVWARTAAEESGISDLKSLIEELTPDEQVGDVQIRRILRSKGITPPEVMADNGPVLRGILSTAVKVIQYNDDHDGQIFDGLRPLKHLGRAGPAEDI